MEDGYIQNSVGNALTNALQSLLEHKLHNTKHPIDAIQFIGEYLIKESEIQQRIGQRKTKKAKILDIQEEIAQEKRNIISKFKVVLAEIPNAVVQREQKIENERIRREEELRLKQEQEAAQKAAEEAQKSADENPQSQQQETQEE